MKRTKKSRLPVVVVDGGAVVVGPTILLRRK